MGHVRSFSDRPIRVRCWGKRKFKPRRTGVGCTPDQVSAASIGTFVANKRHGASAKSSEFGTLRCRWREPSTASGAVIQQRSAVTFGNRICRRQKWRDDRLFLVAQVKSHDPTSTPFGRSNHTRSWATTHLSLDPNPHGLRPAARPGYRMGELKPAPLDLY